MFLSFFFFSRKNGRSRVCVIEVKKRNVLEFFSRKKKSKLARWALASVVQSFSVTRFSLSG